MAEYLTNPVLWLSVALWVCGYIVGLISGYRWARASVEKAREAEEGS